MVAAARRRRATARRRRQRWHLRITPQRPVPELRAEALVAQPPVESGQFRSSDLVELTKLDPTIKLDISLRDHQ
jgi:hypothetical protein